MKKQLLKSRQRKSLCALLTVAAMLLNLCSGFGSPKKAMAAGYGIADPVVEDGVATWDTVYFGHYWQNDTNGDGKADQQDSKDEIRWRVLSVDGNDAFLISDTALDARPYHSKSENISWEKSALRGWLNGEFFDDAFSGEEQKAVSETQVENKETVGNASGVPGYGGIFTTDAGNDTDDKVYLLSVEEASNSDYGFNGCFTAYTDTRVCEYTSYIKRKIVEATDPEERGKDGWWLRSPGSSEMRAAYVGDGGYGMIQGQTVPTCLIDCLVRPVIHLNLSNASVWKKGEKVSASGVEYTESGTGSYGSVSNPVVTEDSTTWDTVYFGHYWQNDTNGDGSADNDDTKEKIKWRVLSVNGDDAFLLADQNLDCKCYNESYTDVTWETCSIRSWLNGYGSSSNVENKDYSSDNFLTNAFSSVEQAAIKPTSGLNGYTPYYDTAPGNDTTDKVFLLSIEEVCNASYGFDSKYYHSSQTREAKNTEYAKSQGAWTSSSSNCKGNGYWWLRSARSSARRAAFVTYDGYYGYGNYNYYDNVNYNFGAVRPALHLSLSSSLWSYAGKVTSKGSNNSDSGYSSHTYKTVVGQLQGLDRSAGTVTVEGSRYSALSGFDYDGAEGIINGETDRTVVCRLKDNRLEKLIRISDVQTEAHISVEPEITELKYADGKLDQKQIEVRVTVKCISKANEFSTEKISEYLASHTELKSNIGLTCTEVYFKCFAEGSNAYLKKTLLDEESEENSHVDQSLSMGESFEKQYTVRLKDDYQPSGVNGSISLTAKVTSDAGETAADKYINVKNLDRQKAVAEAKASQRDSVALMQKVQSDINSVYGDMNATDINTKTAAYFTQNQIASIEKMITLWLGLSVTAPQTADEDNDIVDKFVKLYHTTRSKLQKKLLKKLGIDPQTIPIATSSNARMTIELVSEKDGKSYSLDISVDYGSYKFMGSSDFAGFGKITWVLRDSEKQEKCRGVGLLTHVDMDTFIKDIKAVMLNSMNTAYNLYYGKYIDEAEKDARKWLDEELNLDVASKKLIDQTVADAFTKSFDSVGLNIEVKEGDKASGVIFKVLTAGARMKRTGIYCPVDVYVYDTDGTLCGSIVDNKADTAQDDLVMYTDGDAKFVEYAGDDYIVKFVGNDTGLMSYVVEECEDEVPVRTLSFENIPLEKDKEYLGEVDRLFYGDANAYVPLSMDGTKAELSYDTLLSASLSDDDSSSNEVVHVDSLTMDQEELSLVLPDHCTGTISCHVSPENAEIQDILWNSEDESVAAVDETGKVTAVGIGETYIYAKSFDGLKGAACKVTVKEASDTEPSMVPTGAAASASPIPVTVSSSPAADDSGSSSAPSSSAGASGRPNAPSPSNTATVPRQSDMPDSTSTARQSTAPKQSTTPRQSTAPRQSTDPKQSTTPRQSIAPRQSTDSTASPIINTEAPQIDEVITPAPEASITPIYGPPAPSATFYAPAASTSSIRIATPRPTSWGSSSASPNPGKGSDEDLISDEASQAEYRMTSGGSKLTVEYVSSEDPTAKKIKIPNTITYNGKTYKVTSIAKDAFKNNKDLKTVTIGNNVIKIGKGAFQNCKKLTMLTIGKNVKRIGNKAFYHCGKLKYIMVWTKKLKAKGIGKDAFAKGHAAPRLKSDKTVWRMYSKIFPQKGLSRRTEYIIDPTELK